MEKPVSVMMIVARNTNVDDSGSHCSKLSFAKIVGLYAIEETREDVCPDGFGFAYR